MYLQAKSACWRHSTTSWNPGCSRSLVASRSVVTDRGVGLAGRWLRLLMRMLIDASMAASRPANEQPRAKRVCLGACSAQPAACYNGMKTSTPSRGQSVLAVAALRPQTTTPPGLQPVVPRSPSLRGPHRRPRHDHRRSRAAQPMEWTLGGRGSTDPRGRPPLRRSWVPQGDMARHGLLYVAERTFAGICSRTNVRRSDDESAGHRPPYRATLPYAMSGNSDRRSRKTPEKLGPAVRESAGQRPEIRKVARETTPISGGGRI